MSDDAAQEIHAPLSENRWARAHEVDSRYKTKAYKGNGGDISMSRPGGGSLNASSLAGAAFKRRRK